MYSIYIITNTQTGRVYVGRTKNTNNRFAVHRSELRLVKHSNHELQADYTANPNIWHYQIIESIIEREDAKNAEHDWINAFPEAYNMLGRGDYVANCIRKGSPLRAQKISNALKRPCTVDGITIYPSKGALTAIFGQGKAGGRNPNFRYVSRT